MVECWSTGIPFMSLLEFSECFQRGFLFQLKSKMYTGEKWKSEKYDVFTTSKEERGGCEIDEALTHARWRKIKEIKRKNVKTNGIKRNTNN